MTNVHKLTDTLLPGEVDTDLADTVRELLAQIERGEITALAWSGYRANNAIFTGWEGGAGTIWPLSASVGLLNTRFSIYMAAGDDE